MAAIDWRDCGGIDTRNAILIPPQKKEDKHMTSRDFCYWLQGFFELNEQDSCGQTKPVSFSQIDCIKKHLSLVFKHEIDPSFPASQQEELSKIHQGDVHISQANMERIQKRVDAYMSEAHDSGIIRC